MEFSYDKVSNVYKDHAQSLAALRASRAPAFHRLMSDLFKKVRYVGLQSFRGVVLTSGQWFEGIFGNRWSVRCPRATRRRFHGCLGIYSLCNVSLASTMPVVTVLHDVPRCLCLMFIVVRVVLFWDDTTVSKALFTLNWRFHLV